MKVLYIIGNGFDQAHEIASSYKDFKHWVKSQHSLRFDAEIAQIEYLFRDNGELWADFETNLGHYKIDIIAEQRFGILPFMIQEYDFDGDIKEQVFGNNMPYIESLTEALQRIFRNWVYSLDTKKNPRYSFTKEAFFLSFNYTDTLERVYRIPDKNILHIHGSVLNKNENLIFGHNNYVDPLSVVIEGNDIRDNNERIDKICEMNNLIKPCYNIIDKNISFFKNLARIKDVWVYGHSYNDIDLPYFRKIRQSVSPSAIWHMSWHVDSDVNRLMSLKKVIDINDNHLETFYS